MKKIIYVLPLLAAVMSCTKEPETTVEEPDVNDKVVIEMRMPSDVTSADLVTKTAMGNLSGGKYPVFWSEDDKVSVNGVESAEISVNADNAKLASFSVSGVEYPYCAVYPSAVASDFSESSAVVSLPAVQSYKPGTFDPSAAVMLGYADGDDMLAFSHVMTYLYITVSSVDDFDSDDIKTVTVKSLGTEPLSGKFSAHFSSEGCSIDPVSGNTSSEVRLDCGTGVSKNTPVVIALPASVYGSGLTVSITDVKGHVHTLTASKKLTLAAGHIYAASLRIAAPGIYNNAGYEAFANDVNAGNDLSKWIGDDGEVDLYADLVQEDNYVYINEFAGIFDGNGHKITCSAKRRPLFNTIAEGAVVKNLVTAGTYSAFENQGEQAFSSFARVNLGTIENCTNETSGERTFSTSVAFGGFVGQNGGLIKDCTNKGSIIIEMTSEKGLVCYGGGFAAYGHLADGSKSGRFENCVNDGDVRVTVSGNASLVRTGFGGICGVVIADGVVFSGCVNNGVVSRIDSGAENNTCASAVGGILGRSAHHFSDTYKEWIDMDAGKSYNTKFTDCANNGTVINSVRNGHNFKSQNNDELGNKKCAAGGIAGAIVGKTEDYSVLSGCVNTGKVYSGYNTTNNSHVTGGLAGMARNVRFTDCISTGEVASYNDNIAGPAGGFVGFVRENVTVSGGEARPDVKIKKVSSPSIWSYGLVIGTVRTNGNTSIENVRVGGSITVNGTLSAINAGNFGTFLCVNNHFSYNPSVSGCTWIN